MATPRDSFEPADDVDTGDLPADGTAYSFTDFGFPGFENIYVAAPPEDGGFLPEITDTLVTPFGNLDLSAPYNFFVDLFGDLFGGNEGGGAASGSDVESALYGSDTDFSDVDLAATLANSDLDFVADDFTGEQIVDALKDTQVGDALDIEDGGFSDVGFTPDELADALDNVDVSGGGGGLFDGLF